MDIVVALNGSKERNLSFAPGDSVSLNLIVYANDGDLEPLTPTQFYWSTGGGSFLPVGRQFSFPGVNRTTYSIAADIAGIRTTLVYGIIDAPFGCQWIWGDRWIFPKVIPTTEAPNVLVQDFGEYFAGKSVEEVLQEIGAILRNGGVLPPAPGVKAPLAFDGAALQIDGFSLEFSTSTVGGSLLVGSYPMLFDSQPLAIS